MRTGGQVYSKSNFRLALLTVWFSIQLKFHDDNSLNFYISHVGLIIQKKKINKKLVPGLIQ